MRNRVATSKKFESSDLPTSERNTGRSKNSLQLNTIQLPELRYPSLPELLAFFTMYLPISATNEINSFTNNITCDSALICSQSRFCDYGSGLEGKNSNLMKAWCPVLL